MLELLYHPLVTAVTLKMPQTGATLAIPDHATVNYTIVDGKSGLQVNARNIRNWTPIAAKSN